jgi:hypothetical protein
MSGRPLVYPPTSEQEAIDYFVEGRERAGGGGGKGGREGSCLFVACTSQSQIVSSTLMTPPRPKSKSPVLCILRHWLREPRLFVSPLAAVIRQWCIPWRRYAFPADIFISALNTNMRSRRVLHPSKSSIFPAARVN